jgi:hypothetical protein
LIRAVEADGGGEIEEMVAVDQGFHPPRLYDEIIKGEGLVFQGMLLCGISATRRIVSRFAEG